MDYIDLNEEEYSRNELVIFKLRNKSKIARNLELFATVIKLLLTECMDKNSILLFWLTVKLRYRGTE